MHPIARPIASLIILATLAVAGAHAAPTAGPWPDAKASDWHGATKHEFQFDGRQAWVITPKDPAPGNPWVWRARFPGFHDEPDIILVARGFHVAYVNTNGMLGSPAAMEVWDKFYAFCTQRGLAPRVALEGVSRGGLFIYGFASRWPQRVACIYADTPVCDFKSWPRGDKGGIGHAPTWAELLKQYGFTEQQALEYKGNPIDTLEPIAKLDIPILHVVSLNDAVVPPADNTFILADRYRKLGGSIEIIEVKEGTPQSNGHHFTHPDPLRVADFIEHWSGPLKRAAPTTPGDHHVLRGRASLGNSRIRFERDKVGKVVFMGGSITAGGGWRDATMAYLQQRFPQTKFTFVNAGISSTGSTPGAFRLIRDAFAGGPPDVLFEEAAVNDSTNGRSPTEMTRGMEGIIRHARTLNPNIDIIVMHLAAPWLSDDYRKGATPPVIERHEAAAAHYGVATINLAREVTDRIDAGQFDWPTDFRDLHPSPYGHRLYASAIRRMLSTAWATPLADDAKIAPHAMPPDPLDRFSYDRAKLTPITDATDLKGFVIADNVDPRANGVGGGVRDGFANVPMLVGAKPADSFTLRFTGRAVGLFVAAGPDAGTIEYRIDDGEWQTLDLFTKWSAGLHIPWAYLLAAELPRGDHTLSVRIADAKNDKSKGYAVRIVHLLVNE